MEGIYLVTDQRFCRDRSLEETVMESVRAGASCVQLREKTLSTREFVALGRRLKELMAPFGIPLLINDRIDVALACGADGVHIGQSDMPFDITRKLLGPDAIIGLSVETWEDVENAQSLDVAYLGISPVFATSTKTDTKKPWGLEGIARIRAFSRHPLVGIGGLDRSNAAEVIAAGADCVAVVSAICGAGSPYDATRELAEAVTRVLTLKEKPL